MKEKPRDLDAEGSDRMGIMPLRAYAAAPGLIIQHRRRGLNCAIEVLQGPVKRRGRPPRNPVAFSEATAIPEIKPRRGRPPKSAASSAAAPVAPLRGRKGMSAAAREAVSERMKKYWAERRSKEKP